MKKTHEKFIEEVFRTSKFFGGQKAYEAIKKRDKLKDEYCKINKIKLIRIPYQEFDEIEEILASAV